jgi:hypothetical protein
LSSNKEILSKGKSIHLLKNVFFLLLTNVQTFSKKSKTSKLCQGKDGPKTSTRLVKNKFVDGCWLGLVFFYFAETGKMVVIVFVPPKLTKFQKDGLIVAN